MIVFLVAVWGRTTSSTTTAIPGGAAGRSGDEGKGDDTTVSVIVGVIGLVCIGIAITMAIIYVNGKKKGNC